MSAPIFPCGPTDDRISIVEHWRPIPELRRYEISNTGKVRNAETGKLLTVTNGTVRLTRIGKSYGQRFNVMALLDRAWSAAEEGGKAK